MFDLQDLSPLLPVVTGPVLSFVTEAARRVPAVPFDPKTTAGVRLAVAALSLLAGAGMAYLNGNLAAFDWATAGETLVNAAVIYAGAVTTHDHALKTK